MRISIAIVFSVLLLSCSSSRSIHQQDVGPQAFFTDINSRGYRQISEVFLGEQPQKLGVRLSCDRDSCRWIGFDTVRYALPHSAIRAIRFHSRGDAFLRNLRDYTASGAVAGAGAGLLSAPVLFPFINEEDESLFVAASVFVGLAYGVSISLVASTFTWLFDGTDPDDAGYTSFLFPTASPAFGDALRYRYRYIPPF